MRMSREHLALKALRVLHEAMLASQKGRVERTLGLRLALAYLWSTGTADREVYDGFWLALDVHNPWAWSGQEMNIMRSAEVTAAFNRILHSAGLPPSIDVHAALSRRPGKPEPKDINHGQ